MSTSFDQLGLAEPLLRALRAAGYETPTPIQAGAIPQLLEGRDLLGIAQTGTGKTAAFALPILQRLSASPELKAGPRGCRSLILAPTRELAIQIHDDIGVYGQFLRLKRACIFGGVGQGPQVQKMSRGVDILVATPGRLLDLMNQRHVSLDRVEVLVLDEADRMLDMGFIRDVRKIVAALPGRRQSLLFSATMPGEIEQLSRTLLDDPAKVEIAAKSIAVERIEQRVYHVAMQAKRKLLAALLDDPALSRVIVFTRTKHGANKVATQLGKAGVETEALHGNKSQTARQRALARFRDGDARVLVATDIAARGIDVDEVSHVINYDLPNVPESYVHRIGRTARAGAEGIALSFCDTSEREHLRAIEKLTRVPLAVVEADGFAAPAHEAAGTDKPKGRNRNRNKGPKGPSSPRGEAPGPQAGPKSASQRRRNRRRRARAAGDIQNRRAA